MQKRIYSLTFIIFCMKVIFTKDVPRVGKKDEIKELPNGYVQNFLIPRGLAELASASAIARLVLRKTLVENAKKKKDSSVKEALATLRKANIIMRGKANEQGHLFASIHKEGIAAEIEKKLHVLLSPGYILLDEPIKNIGTHIIKLKAGEEEGVITLLVEAT